MSEKPFAEHDPALDNAQNQPMTDLEQAIREGRAAAEAYNAVRAAWPGSPETLQHHQECYLRLRKAAERLAEQWAEEIDTPRPRNWVYLFERDDGRLQIGFTSDLPYRHNTHQRKTGMAYRTVCLLPGGRLKEARIHERFKHLRLDGELFRDDPEIRDYFLSQPNARINE
jgi:hypothetical protein